MAGTIHFGPLGMRRWIGLGRIIELVYRNDELQLRRILLDYICISNQILNGTAQTAFFMFPFRQLITALAFSTQCLISPKPSISASSCSRLPQTRSSAIMQAASHAHHLISLIVGPCAFGTTTRPTILRVRSALAKDLQNRL